MYVDPTLFKIEKFDIVRNHLFNRYNFLIISLKMLWSKSEINSISREHRELFEYIVLFLWTSLRMLN